MTPRRVPGTPPERPKRRQEHPRSAPRGAKSDPRGARNTLGGTPERSWEPPSAPDGAREGSRSQFWKGFRVILTSPSPGLPLDLLRFSSSLSVPTAKHKNAMKKNETRSTARQSRAAEQKRTKTHA